MDVAVADMAERHRPAAGNELHRRRIGLLDEGRNFRDRHRNVVLDRATLRFLHLAHHVAQMPERLGVLEARRDGGVADEAAFRCGGEHIFHRGAQALARLRRELDQHVPGMRRG